MRHRKPRPGTGLAPEVITGQDRIPGLDHRPPRGLGPLVRPRLSTKTWRRQNTLVLKPRAPQQSPRIQNFHLTESPVTELNKIPSRIVHFTDPRIFGTVPIRRSHSHSATGEESTRASPQSEAYERYAAPRCSANGQTQEAYKATNRQIEKLDSKRL